MTASSADTKAIEALAEKAEARFRPLRLPTPVACTSTLAAQERLVAALNTVNNVFLNMELARELDAAIKQRELRGRISETHVDLLRAAIVFAGAGLDASLKELIRNTIREVSRTNSLSREKFAAFVDEHLAPGDAPVNSKILSLILTSPAGAHGELLDRYERHLTGDSLQSVHQVAIICGALGIDDRKVRERLKDDSLLDEMFRSRNEIIHELDLIPAGRRTRRLEKARDYAAEALSVTQEVINAVGRSLKKETP